SICGCCPTPRSSRAASRASTAPASPRASVDSSLYVVLERTEARARNFAELLALALPGGSRIIQLGEKEWPSGRLLPLAEKLRAACAAAGATFIVNDRVDLGLAGGGGG